MRCQSSFGIQQVLLALVPTSRSAWLQLRVNLLVRLADFQMAASSSAHCRLWSTLWSDHCRVEPLPYPYRFLSPKVVMSLTLQSLVPFPAKAG